MTATASEKTLLALYVTNREVKNHQALKVLSVGPSGLKKIKRRLLSKSLLRPSASGWKLLVPGLMPAPGEAGGHLVSESDATAKANKVALRKVKSLDQILREHNECWESFASQPGSVSTLLFIVRRTLREIQSDVPDGPDKAEAVAAFQQRENAWTCLVWADKHLPKENRRDVDALVASASAEQLAKLTFGSCSLGRGRGRVGCRSGFTAASSLRPTPKTKRRRFSLRTRSQSNRRAVGLEGGGMTTSRRQKCAQVNFKPEDGGHSHNPHDVSDFQEVTRRGIYFHGSTVDLHRLKVLIEKVC